MVTGGTGSTVKIVHSGRATSGRLIPSGIKSSSGIFSIRARISAGVSLCSTFLPSSTTTSENVVGFSKFILSCWSPQWGQMRSFFTSFSESKSPVWSSSVPTTFSISSGLNSTRPQERQVTRRSFLMSRVYPTWMTGFASSMCPKCPGHSLAFWSQVLHRRPGSITPRFKSMSPWG